MKVKKGMKKVVLYDMLYIGNKHYNNSIRGITLIALVITIIVLLILAGVSIAMLTGNNGIIKQAQRAKIETEKQGIKEQIEVCVLSSIDEAGNINKNELLKELDKLPEGKNIVDEGDKIYVVYPDYIFEIDLKTKEVTYLEVEVSKDKTPGQLEGEGTEQNPYKIESVEDLVQFIEDGRTNDYSGKTIVLSQSLNIYSNNSYVDANTKKYGDYNEDGSIEGLKAELTNTSGEGLKSVYQFSGKIDGKNNKIEGIYKKIDSYYFFGGLIKDLREGGTIENLTLSGKMEATPSGEMGYYRLGGIVGRNETGSKINNCINNIEISVNISELLINNAGSSLSIGGISGNNEGVITNVINNKNITININENTTIAENAVANYIGGIVGMNQNQLINSINYGDINYERKQIGNIETTRNSKIGGIVGYEYGQDTILANSVNIGTVIAKSTGNIAIGGIIGETSSNQAGVKNVFNKGNIFSNSDMNMILGGIVGSGYRNFTNVYNIGIISTNNTQKEIGAIIGDVHTSSSSGSNTVIENAYYKPQEGIFAAQSGEFEGITSANDLNEQKILEYMNINVNTNNQNPDNAQWKVWQTDGSIIYF